MDMGQYQEKKLVAFDLYGTCIHRPKQLFNNGFSISKDLKIILETNPINIDTIASGRIEFNGKLFKLRQKEIKKIQKDIAGILLYPDFNGIIDYLKSKGYKTAVVSNLAQPYEEPMRRLIEEGSFDYEALSFNVGAMKPSPEIFEYLKKQSGIDFEDMILVGDSLKSDVKGAHEVGITPIHLHRGHKSSPETIKKDGIEFVQISTLADLKEIL